MNFSERLRALMKERNESGYALAKSIPCSQSTVSNWLAGQNKPTRHMIKALSEHYGVPIESLTFDVEES